MRLGVRSHRYNILQLLYSFLRENVGKREYHLHGWANLQMSVRLFPGGLSNIKVYLKFNFSCAIYGLEEKRCCFFG